MQTISDLTQIYDAVKAFQQAGQVVGVVPTMGALHEGHLSLVRAAQKECDRVAVTIFLNPTQFSPTEDLEKYPQPLEEDLAKLEELGVDIVFCPQQGDMYPPGYSTFVEPPEISHPFEGSSRSSHFRGVATIVLKLFNLLPAQWAFFGQKDYQQTLVIRKMVADLNVPIEIVVCPIVREADGLAMSSRNSYLSPADRERASSLYQGLKQTQKSIVSGNEVNEAVKLGRAAVEAAVDELEYFAVVDAETLKESSDRDAALIILVAARVGSTRLIDNLLVRQ